MSDDTTTPATPDPSVVAVNPPTDNTSQVESAIESASDAPTAVADLVSQSSEEQLVDALKDLEAPKHAFEDAHVALVQAQFTGDPEKIAAAQKAEDDARAALVSHQSDLAANHPDGQRAIDIAAQAVLDARGEGHTHDPDQLAGPTPDAEDLQPQPSAS